MLTHIKNKPEHIDTPTSFELFFDSLRFFSRGHREERKKRQFDECLSKFSLNKSINNFTEYYSVQTLYSVLFFFSFILFGFLSFWMFFRPTDRRNQITTNVVSRNIPFVQYTYQPTKKCTVVQ